MFVIISGMTCANHSGSMRYGEDSPIRLATGRGGPIFFQVNSTNPGTVTGLFLLFESGKCFWLPCANTRSDVRLMPCFSVSLSLFIVHKHACKQLATSLPQSTVTAVLEFEARVFQFKSVGAGPQLQCEPGGTCYHII